MFKKLKIYMYMSLDTDKDCDLLHYTSNIANTLTTTKSGLDAKTD
jgi:hypothetical protein